MAWIPLKDLDSTYQYGMAFLQLSLKDFNGAREALDGVEDSECKTEMLGIITTQEALNTVYEKVRENEYK